MSEKREALKTAAETAAALEAQVQRLKEAAARAACACDDAEDALAGFDDLEDQVTKWRVAQLKKGASTKELPDKLKDRVDAKRAANDEVELSRLAARAIDEELKAAQSKLKITAKERMNCAVAVLHHEGDVLADELRAINVRRAELLQILTGLGAVEIFSEKVGRPLGIGLSEAATEAVNMGHQFAFQQCADPEVEIARRWKKRLDALCADPDTVVVTPKHVVPSDFTPGDPPHIMTIGQPWSPGTPGTWKPEQAS